VAIKYPQLSAALGMWTCEKNLQQGRSKTSKHYKRGSGERELSTLLDQCKQELVSEKFIPTSFYTA
jgi:hypothetical protein